MIWGLRRAPFGLARRRYATGSPVGSYLRGLRPLGTALRAALRIASPAPSARNSATY
jgi:hypothetical protein